MWFQYIYSLAKGDVTKIPEITKLNFIFCMNIKSFEQDNKDIRQYYDNR